MAANNETAEFVRNLAEGVHAYRAEMEGEHYVNASYYAGKHHIYWDSTSRTVVEPAIRSRSEVRLSVALTTTVIQRLIARMIRDRKEWVPAPLSGEEGHLLAARSLRKLLQHYWEWYHLPRLLREEALPSMLLFGKGWLSVKWDPSAGRQMGLHVPAVVRPGKPSPEGTLQAQREPVDEQLEQVRELFGESAEGLPPEAEGMVVEDGEAEPVWEGDFVFGAPSHYNILTDPFAFRHEQLRWLIEEQLVPLQEVEEVYGKKVDADGYSDSPYRDAIAAGFGTVGSIYGALPHLGAGSGKYVKKTGLYSESDKLVVLRTLYTAPNKREPDGRMVVVAGDQLLEAVANPYGLIPFVPIPCFPIPGSPVATPLMSLMRPLQLAIDRAVSQFVRNVRMFGNPQWLAKRNIVLDPSAFDDTEGRLIQYKGDPQDPAAKPQRLDSPYLGQSGFTSEIALLREMLYEVAGLNEASRGENPAGGRSAEMIYALSSKDDEGNLPVQQGFDDALGDMGRIILQVGKRFFKETRMARVVGVGGDVLVAEVKLTDIQNGFDVKVRGDSYLPRRWSQRVDLAFKMAQSGLVDTTNPDERVEFLRMLELGSIDSMWDKGEESERINIHRENLQMLAGDAVEVHSYDLHKAHAYGHSKFRRSEEFRRTMDAMPEAQRAAVQASFDAHSDEHYDWLRVGQGLDPVGGAGEPGQPTGGDLGAPVPELPAGGEGLPPMPEAMSVPGMPQGMGLPGGVPGL